MTCNSPEHAVFHKLLRFKGIFVIHLKKSRSLRQNGPCDNTLPKASLAATFSALKSAAETPHPCLRCAHSRLAAVAPDTFMASESLQAPSMCLSALCFISRVVW